MSMTKRYLESLPKEQQDDILGLPPGGWLEGQYETIPQTFCKSDEWVESAENEPWWDIDEDGEYAETLTDETEDEQC